jgi:hypothetical protein
MQASRHSSVVGHGDCITVGLATPKGVIRMDIALKVKTEVITFGKEKAKDDENMDLHTNLLCTVTLKQKFDFVDQCYSPSDKATKNMGVLSNIQVSIGVTSEYCTGQRGEHVTLLKYKLCLTRKRVRLGPTGTDCDVIITNRGKTNVNGHIMSRTIPPHV